MIVLSLFDGMSCGQIALKELGAHVERYYASEVDKFAIAQTQLNFPETVQLGDVRNIDARKLGHVDLLLGGSPCQSFSFAGKRAGMSTKQNEEIYTLDRYLELKQAGFEFEGQSYLFWEYIRILHELRETNPNVFFLLENVEMGKKWEKVLSEAIGLQGVHINSALVSAQIRKRIYWTNIRIAQTTGGDWITDIPQPEDKGILLRDILEDDADVDEKFYLKAQTVQNLIAHKLRNEAAGRNYGAVFHTGGGRCTPLK
ncbi:MAG: DNA cytosine methyltransferase [Alistipes sp.]|nr:DNA cytosine methyltransferase [Alistipes sp.]